MRCKDIMIKLVIAVAALGTQNILKKVSLRAGSLVGRVSLAKELREEWGEEK